MSAALPVVSCICAILLAALIPLSSSRISVPNLSIISWLFVSNVIHSINTIAWAGNIDIHAPVWCDMSTKILLGLNMVIPGACLCISGHLAHVSSIRPMRHKAQPNRISIIIEICLCIVLPLIYIALHSIVQDHRFDIIEDFGCEAAIYPSVSSIFLIWVGPLFECSLALVFSSVALYHAATHPSTLSFTENLKSRSDLTASYFFSRAAACIITISLLAALFVFSVAATISSGLLPWTSLSEVHSGFNQFAVASSETLDLLGFTRAKIEWTWWTTPVLSVIFIVHFGTSEEALNRYRLIRKWLKKRIFRRSDMKALVLPTQATKKIPQMISTSQPGTPIDLRSGWDDTFDFKKSKMKPKAKAAALAYSLPTTPEEDASFTASTLTYLESPVAHTLGLPGPSPPSQSPWPQRRESLKDPQSPDGHSLLRASWPSPPLSVPPRASSPTSVSADGHTFGYPLYPAVTPPHLRAVPFQGRTVTEVPSLPKEMKHTKRLSSRSFSSLRSPSRPQSREKISGHAPSDVIYMTVVKETEAS